MALYYDLPVFKATYDLLLKIFEVTKDFPREYKYSLCLMRSIYRANKAKDKQQYLEAFLDDFELLKLEIRLSTDMRIVPGSRSGELVGLMDSIGKQITAWRNAVR